LSTATTLSRRRRQAGARGTVISKVVELFPNRARRLVYVAGYVLDDGEATADANPPHYRQLFQELATASALDSPTDSASTGSLM
jgi:hypothetical protein